MFETEMNTILCYKVASHSCSIFISQLLLMLTYLEEAMMVVMIFLSFCKACIICMLKDENVKCHT